MGMTARPRGVFIFIVMPDLIRYLIYSGARPRIGVRGATSGGG